jgi:hypothetical protein
MSRINLIERSHPYFADSFFNMQIDEISRMVMTLSQSLDGSTGLITMDFLSTVSEERSSPHS